MRVIDALNLYHIFQAACLASCSVCTYCWRCSWSLWPFMRGCPQWVPRQ